MIRRPPNFSATRKFSLIALFVSWMLMGLGLGLVGCGKSTGSHPSQLPADYGEAEGDRVEPSVNGLSVLANLFSKAGHTVSVDENLSDDVKKRADVIVWAPDDFGPPAPATVQWLNDWLKAKAGRTLVYIGRDFDAAPVYWKQILAQAPPGDASAVREQLNFAEQQFLMDRQQVSDAAKCEWFSIDTSKPHRDIRTLDGPWSEGIDASKVEIELNSRIVPDDDTDILLQTGDDALVSRTALPAARFQNSGMQNSIQQNASPESQVILVANGSFLLNLPLVNHEHRKLAARLIESVGTARQVVFLPSVEGDAVRSNSSGDHPLPHSMLDIFGIWPLSVILTQWGLVLLLVCFSRWPIFGPPRDPPQPTASDFSRHVAALGEALELTRDEAFAKARWQQYQEKVRSQGGGLYSSGRGVASGSRKIRPEDFRAT